MKGRVHPGFSPPLSLSVTKRPGRAPDRSLSPLILCLSRERNRGNGGASPHLPWLSVPRCLSIVFSLCRCRTAHSLPLLFSLAHPLSRPLSLFPVRTFVCRGQAHLALSFLHLSSLSLVFPLPLLARPLVRPLSLFFAVSLSAAHSLSSCSPSLSPSPSHHSLGRPLVRPLSLFFCCLSFGRPLAIILLPHTHSPSPSHLSLGRPLACQSCLLSFSLCLSPTHSTRSLSPHPLDHCLPTPARSSLVIRKKKSLRVRL
jgi:hypothetical protein